MYIEKDNGKFYVYTTTESGNCVCIGKFNTKKEAQSYIDSFEKAAWQHLYHLI